MTPLTSMGFFGGGFSSPTGHGCSFLLQLMDENQLPHGKKPDLGRRLHDKISSAKGELAKAYGDVALHSHK